MKLFKHLLFIPLIIFISIDINGQARSDNAHLLQAGETSLLLEFYKPDVFRIRTSKDQSFSDEFSYMLEDKSWNLYPVQKIQSNGDYIFNTDKLTLKINQANLQITVLNKAGVIISSESLQNGGLFEEENRLGVRKQLSPEEHFFGFGERMDFLDQRGKALQLNVGRGLLTPHIIGAYNVLEANYAPVPFFMSTKGYGIFFHTTQVSEWDLGKKDKNAMTFEAKGNGIDYFFMYGPEFSQLLYHYTDLTGKSPLLPRFAHGLHVGTYSGGTWGYEEHTSTHYVVALVRKFREKDIPLDVLHLDSTWRMFGKSGGSGATTFEWRETFDNPKSMFDSVYAMDINMVGLHVRPRFDNGVHLDLLDRARDKGHVYPEENDQGEFVNFFDEEAVDWWWENGVMRIAELGAMFLKTDEGSAFGRKANESTKTGPTGETAEKLHNIFPVVYAKAPFEKFKEYNKMRGMNHTREGYSGIQRYPFIWAGDWPSEWQYFAPVIKAGINIGMSGVGYWSHNMGGFEHDADPELYARWVQFGMFSPIAHLFGMDHPGYKEPWNYGKQALDIFTTYDRLRYRLIPYIYTTAHQQNQTGLPIMRALVVHHQDDPETYNIDDQYYFGDQMVICPVTTKGAQTKVIYLPEGEWFDYWNGKSYIGKQYYNVETPLEKLPIFVRSGAIIPMQEEVTKDDNQPYGTVTLDIFPGEAGSFSLYEDDGLSEEYKTGNYAFTKLEKVASDKGISLVLNESEGNYKVPTRRYVLKLRMSEQPTSVLSGSKKMERNIIEAIKLAADGWAYDNDEQIIWLSINKHADQKIDINIQH